MPTTERVTLADARRDGADAVWCLGDLGGFGPLPDRALDAIRAASVPVVRGNYDEAVGHARDDCACGYDDPEDRRFAQIAYDYTLARTSAEHRSWMRSLPTEERLAIGGRSVLLCHGSPRRVNEFLWDSTCSDAFLEWLCRAHGADVILCTHTGLPWHRALPSGRHVVNVGVIGRPANDGRPTGCYARLQFDDAVSIALRPVSYDHEALAREMEIEGLPAEFVATIRTGWWTTCLGNLPAKERRRGRH
ncbi:MAG: metallophosphoesterase family protein [Candidatus Eisenbacteria bacterium]|uniref:Metallophosphoesterase family protein n=1 Tax=Eiseniibacteriota bacterium TaxID=2212470 RepID=A0A538U494_UNCEI|nr:MAG: metallophosphoesterase family protein [Candidatus Eisenbacteria bacterium]